MRNLSRILQLFALLALCAMLAPGFVRADSYSYAPDTVVFSPTAGQDSVVSYVRVSYKGDTSEPGTYIHGWISSGSSYFSASSDTMHIKTHSYIRLVYHVQTGTVTGQLSISDDTVTHTVVLIGHAAPLAPDGELTALGPYFPQTIPEGVDTCTGSTEHPNLPGSYSLRLINSGTDVDTIVSASWTHDPSGIFSWDSASLPLTIAPHDTLYWTFCFAAPHNTTQYLDTFIVHYHDSASQTRYLTRIVLAKATDTTPPDGVLRAVGPYFPGGVPEGADTCMSQGSIWPLVLINGGSDVDTVKSFAWAHDPGSIFSLDTAGTTFPFTIGPGDTMYWTACFHAPSDTEVHWNTLNIRYSDTYSNDRHVTRIVYAKAVDTSVHTCYGLYAAAAPVTNYGNTSYIHLFISNHLDSSTTLTGIHVSGTDDGAFRVDSAGFPNTFASHAYDSLWIRFIPNRTSGSSEYSATATLSFTTNDTAHCHEAQISLVGSMPQSCSDTESITFDTTGSSKVAVSGDSGHYYAHRIDFTNNSSSTLRVTAVGWTHSSSHWLVSQIVPPLPDTLAPGASMAVIVHFYGDSTGTTYYDTLALTISGGYADPIGKRTTQASNGTYYVNFTGYSNATPAGVTPQATANAPELRLYPNPSEGVVNMEIEGATNATFEITDVLGNVLASYTGGNQWQWDANSLALPKDGTYFIRATNGDSVVTKRLVLAR